jgi:ABC-2 type transport system permease protein
MGTILHIFKKELIQIKRDPRILPMFLVAPVIQLVLLGYAASFDIRNIPIAVCDMDISESSRTLARSFITSGYFRIVKNTRDMDSLDAMLASNEVRMGILIPAGFERSVLRGAPEPVGLIIDGTDTMTAVAGAGYARMIISQSTAAIGAIPGMPAVPIPTMGAELRIWYNQEIKSAFFMVPAIFALLLSVVAMVIPSMAIVKEKELGTIEQLYVSPIKPWQLIAGKMLPFVVIAFINVILVTAIGYFWFGVPMRGSMLNLFVAVSLFLLSSLGLGLFISTAVQTQQQAMMVAIFVVMFPSILLSGFAFPIDNIPAPIRPLSYVLPVTYFIAITRGLFLRATTFRELLPSYAALTALGVVILTLAIARFRKSLG